MAWAWVTLLVIVVVAVAASSVTYLVTRGGTAAAPTINASNPVSSLVTKTLTEQATGTWTCAQDSPPKSGAWNTATVTIDADGTFTVTYAAAKEPIEGTWKLDGTTLTIQYPEDSNGETFTGVALGSTDVIVGSDKGDFAVTRTGDNEVKFQEKPLDDQARRRFDFTCKR